VHSRWYDEPGTHTITAQLPSSAHACDLFDRNGRDVRRRFYFHDGVPPPSTCTTTACSSGFESSAAACDGVCDPRPGPPRSSARVALLCLPRTPGLAWKLQFCSKMSYDSQFVRLHVLLREMLFVKPRCTAKAAIACLKQNTGAKPSHVQYLNQKMQYPYCPYSQFLHL